MTIKSTRTNEKKIIVGRYPKADLKVDYFWDNHGKLINWNEQTEEPTSWSDVKVQIYKYSFTEKLIEREFDFETFQLIINGKTLSGELRDWTVDIKSGKYILQCRVVVGWG